MRDQVINSLKQELEQADLFPINKQAELSTRILHERLEQVLPWAMEQSGFDCWMVLSRENCEDPIIRTLFTWDMPEARRVSILIFSRNKKTGEVRRMAVGMHSPEMSKLYENVQNQGEDIWAAAGRIIRELAPERIAVDRSLFYGFCDGLSSTLLEQLRKALGAEYAAKIEDGEDLTVRWLQRVTPLEKAAMKVLVHATHEIVNYTFSRDFVQPGITTTTDIEWEMRRIMNELGYLYWFGPDVDLQREGNPVTRVFEETVQPGDLLHCDIGINGVYVHLHTDMQWVAYVCKEVESDAPAELQTLLDQGNRFRDIVCKEMQTGRTGNDIFVSAMEKAKQEGIRPMLYTHPLGTFGHGAGPSIGMYTNQGFVPGTGERCVEEETCYALELNVCGDVTCWGGQTVYMYLEEDICKSGKADYIDGHQTKLMLL